MNAQLEGATPAINIFIIHTTNLQTPKVLISHKKSTISSLSISSTIDHTGILPPSASPVPHEEKRVRWISDWIHEEHRPVTRTMTLTHKYPSDFFYTQDDFYRFHKEVVRESYRSLAAWPVCKRRRGGDVTRMKMHKKTEDPRKEEISFLRRNRKLGAYNTREITFLRRNRKLGAYNTSLPRYGPTVECAWFGS